MKANKQQFRNIKGMKKDVIESSLTSEYAYELNNLRITPIDEENMFGLINEKGNKKITIYLNNPVTENTELVLSGTPIGSCVVGDFLVIVTTNDSTTNLINTFYVIKKENNKYIGNKWSDNLDLYSTNPLEILGFYENENIQKIYWTDSKHQLRFLNLVNIYNIDNAVKIDIQLETNVVPKVTYLYDVTITKLSNGGYFKSGIIQYIITQQNKYGQESNIIYISPIYYINPDNNGGNPNLTCTNSFKIDYSEASLNSNLSFINIYSIYRSSISGTPETKLLYSGYPCDEFIDNGQKGSIQSDTFLLTVGGEPFIPETITQKANKVFLGNISFIRKELSDDEKEDFGVNNISGTAWSKEYTNIGFIIDKDQYGNSRKKITLPDVKGLYPYKNQLETNSSKTTTFKYGETYRFGVQLMDFYGRWSDPIWIEDRENTVSPKVNNFYNSSSIYLPIYHQILTATKAASLSVEYQAIRPVVVYPSLYDRTIVAQGVVCPTVFNLKNRYDNNIYAQSSWFVRPCAPFNPDSTITTYTDFTDSSIKSLYSEKGLTTVDKVEVNSTEIDGTEYLSQCAYRHYESLAKSNSRNSEIQLYKDNTNRLFVTDDSDADSIVNQNSYHFYVDQSIVTLHSPELEFNTDFYNYDLSKCKFRIVGIVPITSSASSIDLMTQNIASGAGIEQYRKTIFNENNVYGFRAIYNTPRWRENRNLFTLCPWQDWLSATDDNEKTMLRQKYMSHMFFSNKTVYLKPNKFIKESDSINADFIGVEDVKLFNSLQDTLIKLKITKGQGTSFINYYGNINNQTLVSGSKDFGEIIASQSGKALYNGDITVPSATGSTSINLTYKSTNHAVISLKSKFKLDNTFNLYKLPTLKQYTRDGNVDYSNSSGVSSYFEKCPIWMKLDKYKLNAIMYPEVLLTDFNDDLTRYDINSNLNSLLCGYLWLGELYNDNITNRFGGNTTEAIMNNKWMIAGETYPLSAKAIDIYWEIGDTYYQRYDHLKTYPYTEEDKNQNTEVISFMCETHINLDGRYDLNRGLEDNSTVRPENFNQLNKVYSQENNYFVSMMTDSDNAKLVDFPNTITWSETKVSGELKDSWTILNAASSVDVDGTYGEITKLINFNDTIIAFQENALSKIPYQEREQISTESGEPIEIMNSTSVGTPQLLFRNIGCRNKWAVLATATSLYFIDDNNKSIYFFDKGTPISLSDNKGFKSWINNALPDEFIKWNPKDCSNFIIQSDIITGDVYFINKEYCLTYNEILGEFSSFYSYNNTPFIINYDNKGIAINNGLWEQHMGEYNSFFGEKQGFSVSVYANIDSNIDKIFNTVDFRSETYVDGQSLNITDWRYLTAETPYQKGMEKLIFNAGVTGSSLRRKYRIWRANIPRNNIKGVTNTRMDRIRNPWAIIKLASESYKLKIYNSKTILHDFIVNVTEL